MSDVALKRRVGLEADGVVVALGLKEVVKVRQREGGITPEEPPLDRATTGSNTSRQPSALWTLPGRSEHRSKSPNWLNTNNG